MKSTPILERTILCPRCQTKTMRKSHGGIVPFFCDKCHSYFGIDELVNKWGYDLGDFWYSVKDNWYEQKPIMDTIEQKEKKEKIIATTWFDTKSTVVMDEPVFKSVEDKIQSYELVNRMFEDEEEWELDGTSNENIDTGLYR